MKSVIAALLANIAVAISKLAGAGLTGSVALANEAIHSFVDCLNQIILIVADKNASEAPTKKHPFGTSRNKYFASMIVAGLLFFGGGLLGIYEAVEKLTSKEHALEYPYVILAILIFGLIIESTSLRIAFKEINELNTQKQPLFEFLHNSKHSEILVIFAEDSCAIIGLILALLGTLASMITGNPIYDALSGLAIGLLLTVAAIFLTAEFKSLILGESISQEDLLIIRNVLTIPDVSKIIDIKGTHISPTTILLGIKLEYANNGNNENLTNALEVKIREQFPDYKCFIYIEVDTFRDDYDR